MVYADWRVHDPREQLIVDDNPDVTGGQRWDVYLYPYIR